MKQQLAILLFISLTLGLVSALAKPGAPGIYISDNCTDAYYCVKLNGKCTADFFYSNVTQCTLNNLKNAKSDPVCCSYTQMCVNQTCMNDNVGNSCSTDSECHTNQAASYVTCVNKFCRAVYGAGDTCKTNDDCFNMGGVTLQCGTNNSQCTGLAKGAKCIDTASLGLGISTCAAGLYCDSKMMCSPVLASGFACNNSKGEQPCPTGQQCNGVSDTAGKCVAVGTVASGANCGGANLACASGSVCSGNTCMATSPYKLVSCTNDSDCASVQSTGTCECYPGSGKGYCTFSGLNASSLAATAESAINLVNCLAKYNCSYDPWSPTTVNTNKMSCAVENCNSYVKKYITAASCNGAKVGGTCFSSTYCSGFPVWAIIVIVVVAVILVLSVVIVVFLVLRKRRDYSSI